MQNNVRSVAPADIDSVVALSEKKRLQYQSFQPLFWRKATNSAAIQKPYLENLISKDHILALAYFEQERICGFVVANVGKEAICNIDDFAVADDSEWQTVGNMLLQEVGVLARHHQATKYEVVCGHLDQPKRAMLQSAGLHVARYWFTCAIEPAHETVEQIHVRTASASDAPDIAHQLSRGDDNVPEIANEQLTVLVAEHNGAICGCLIALVAVTPPVYDPGGATCLVTEFKVVETGKQDSICNALLNEMGQIASQKDAVQHVVMCDVNDLQSQSLLTKFGMTIASEWYSGNI